MGERLQERDHDEPPPSGQRIDEELQSIQQRGCQFNCLGLGCLSWLAILTLVVIVAYFWKRSSN